MPLSDEEIPVAEYPPAYAKADEISLVEDEGVRPRGCILCNECDCSLLKWVIVSCMTLVAFVLLTGIIVLLTTSPLKVCARLNFRLAEGNRNKVFILVLASVFSERGRSRGVESE